MKRPTYCRLKCNTLFLPRITHIDINKCPKPSRQPTCKQTIAKSPPQKALTQHSSSGSKTVL